MEKEVQTIKEIYVYSYNQIIDMALADQLQDVLVVSLLSDEERDSIDINLKNNKTIQENLMLIPNRIDIMVDDLESPLEGHILMNVSQSHFILRSIENTSFDIIYIHCAAGVSRSPAVALALNTIYGYTLVNIPQNYKLYNRHIYNILINAYYRRDYK